MKRSNVLIIVAEVIALAGLGVVITSSGSLAQDAAALYAKQCASCHGAKGKGDGAVGQYLKPKPTDFAVSLKGQTDEWIEKSITGGGTAVGKSAVMPAYPKLTPDQAKGLVAYVKSLGS
jgi:mono/diheme cytochrome c family protein